MKDSTASFIALLVACGPAVDDPSGSGADDSTSGDVPNTTSNTTSSGTAPGTSASPATDTLTSTADPSTTTEDPSTSGPACKFGCSSSGDPLEDCSLFDQDCPEGEKCMPWANDGGNAWNDTKCVDVADNPDAVGESCTVEGSGVSGVDSCDGTSMCFDVDPDSNVGRCYAFCTGDESDPMCPNECDFCTISGDGVLTICLPTCDPVLQDCDEGDACYLFSGGETRFVCAPDASGKAGAAGEVCEFPNSCDEGTMCISSDFVPDCEGGGCCSPFCTVGDDTPCAVIPGTACVPVMDEPVDACIGNAGICGTPE